MANLNDILTMLQQKASPAIESAKDIYMRMKASKYGQVATQAQQLMQKPAIATGQLIQGLAEQNLYNPQTKTVLPNAMWNQGNELVEQWRKNPNDMQALVDIAQKQAMPLAMGFTMPSPQTKGLSAIAEAQRLKSPSPQKPRSIRVRRLRFSQIVLDTLIIKQRKRHYLQ